MKANKSKIKEEGKCDYCHYVRGAVSQGTRVRAQLPESVRLCDPHAQLRRVMVEAYIGYELELLSDEEYGNLIRYADSLAFLIAIPTPRPGYRPAP